MNGRFLLAPLLLGALSGCESSFNRDFVNVGSNNNGNEVGVPAAEVDRYAKQEGISRQEASDRLRRGEGPDRSASGKTQTSLPGSVSGPDLAALPAGSPCRIDLIRPAGKGQAYQGTIVRVEPNAIVMSNVISEGPTKRPRSPTVMELLTMRWGESEKTIGWERLPDKEVRIARSEVASARVLDHDPIVDYYRR
jgi:hypothetical protein